MLALLALVFVAYSNSFQASLVFDNEGLIAEDPRIREVTPHNIQSILTGGYWYVNATSGLYRPLTTLSYLMNYAVLGDGPRPAGYHWINIALHGTNVALVYALGILIFGESALALALAAIWGLHPLLTESVTNIVGRADLLAAFGVLAGLLFHARGASAVGQRRLAWLAGLVTAQAAGLFSKESAAVLPGIMLLYDLTWPERAKWRGRAFAYAALALPFGAWLFARGGFQTHMLIEFAENPLVSASFWTGRLTAVKVIGKFLWLFIWPVRLSADYSYNAIPLFGWRVTDWEDAQALLALVVCLSAGLLALLLATRWRRTGKPLLFFLVFFFIALTPTSNLIIPIGSIMAERFLYLPSIGLAGCLVAAIQALSKRRAHKWSWAPQAAWITTVFVCLVFTARTYARNFDWQDAQSLWASAVTVCPESARPHYNLATALAQIPGRLPEAIAEYEAALRSQPGLAEAHYSLGNALAHTPGRLPDAIAQFEAAVRIRPDYANAHLNLGNALAHTPGRLPEAIAEYQAVLQIRPDNADAHNNLGNALMEFPGRLPEAIAEYEAALRIDPHHANAYRNLEDAHERLRAGRR